MFGKYCSVVGRDHILLQGKSQISRERLACSILFVFSFPNCPSMGEVTKQSPFLTELFN